MLADGTLNIETELDPTGFNTGVASLVKSLGALAVSATAVVIGILGVQSVKAVATLSAEFQRLRIAAQAVGQIYGITAIESRKLIDSLKEQGIQSDAASRAFTNFAKEGLELNLLPALARGAQDLNALAESGASSSDVFNGLLGGILRLDAQMLKSQGIVVDLQQAYRDYAATLGKTAGALSTQEMRTAAMMAVIEKLKGVTGLYELSQKTAAGQLSSNKRIMLEFQNVIGGAFQDAFYNLIKSFNTFIKALTTAFSEGGRLRDLWLNMAAVASLLSRAVKYLLDLMSAWLGMKASEPAKEAAPAMDAMAESADDAAAAQDKLGASVEATAKKAGKALAAFDSLNVLQQDNADIAGAGADAGLIDPFALGDPTGVVDASLIEDPLLEIQKRADEILEKIKTKLAEWRDKILEILKPFIPIWEMVKLKWDEATEAITAWIEENPEKLKVILIILGLLAIAILAAAVVFGILTLALGAFAAISAIVASPILLISIAVGLLIALFIAWGLIIATFIHEYWPKLSKAASDAWEWIQEKWGEAKEWFSSTVIEPIKEKFAEIWENIKTFASDAWDRIKENWSTTSDWFNETVIEPIKNFFSSMWDFIKILAHDAWAVISYGWSLVSEWFNATVIEPVTSIFVSMWENIKNYFTETWEAIQITWEAVVDWFSTNITTPLTEKFAQAWENIKEFAKLAWNRIQEIFKGVTNWASEITQPLRDAFSSALDWIGDKFREIFDGTKEFLRGVVNDMIGIIEGLANSIISMFNGVIDGANIFGNTIPDWISIPNIGEISLPHLATGAVIPPNAQFAAILGDNKSQSEILAPEDTLRRIMAEELANSGGGNQNITIRFEGSLAELGRILKPVLDKENTRVGGSLVTSGIRA